jgi:hypothetical protein
MCIAAGRGGRRGIARKLEPTLVNSLPISELNNSNAARPVSFEKQTEQPASAAYRALRGVGCACPRGRATGLVWASPEGAGRSPQFCAAQLGSQSLAVHAICYKYARYAASGRLPAE